MEWPSVMSLGGNRYKALNRGFEHLSAVTVETNFIWMPEEDLMVFPVRTEMYPSVLSRRAY
jgi:hypothetical protein